MFVFTVTVVCTRTIMAGHTRMVYKVVLCVNGESLHMLLYRQQLSLQKLVIVKQIYEKTKND